MSKPLRRVQETRKTEPTQADALRSSEVRIACAKPSSPLTVIDFALHDARNECALLSAHVESLIRAPARPDIVEVLADVSGTTERLAELLGVLATLVKHT
jgi:hypothetical protein